MIIANPTVITSDLQAELSRAIGVQPGSDCYVLTDTTTARECLPYLHSCGLPADSRIITVKAGDEHKNIGAAVHIWEFLSSSGATRKSLFINLGGGMITDLGGFAASTFKRGIRYINIPTSLLGAVDAATGGKTGINLMGLKNEVGVFNPAEQTIIDVQFFKSLDAANLRSGYAEMVKHALIDTPQEWKDVLAFDLEEVDFDELRVLVERSVRIKERVVEQDPTEMNIRKALNLGHTFGHAFESYSHRVHRPALHGYAVMWGLLCELYLSHVQLGFPKEELLRLKYMMAEYYGKLDFACGDYEELYELMTHDKKNDSGFVNFTLLGGIGDIRINCTASKEQIFETLDFYLTI
ncbi:MAG: 3-dehydroquinate synthase family protein [Paludibacter sp.]|nr:3-dehydroquinate synthase family protein [Paludibacter sp.]